jgi:hypothetical protein
VDYRFVVVTLVDLLKVISQFLNLVHDTIDFAGMWIFRSGIRIESPTASRVAISLSDVRSIRILALGTWRGKASIGSIRRFLKRRDIGGTLRFEGLRIVGNTHVTCNRIFRAIKDHSQKNLTFKDLI